MNANNRIRFPIPAMEFAAERLDDILNASLGLAALAAFASAMLRGFTGFGANLILAPVLAALFGPVEAIRLVMITSIVGAAPICLPAARIVDWREMAPILAASAVFTPLGVAALLLAEPDFARRAMGAFIIAAAIILFAGWTYRGPRGDAAGAGVGAMGGFITGFSGVGGPVPVIYFMSAPGEARRLRANNVITVSVYAPIGIATFLASGAIGAETLIRAALLVAPYLFGLWAGTRLFRVIPAALFRRLVLILLAAIGISALVF